MPNPVFLLPDLALGMLSYYRGRSELTALLPSSSIATQLPDSYAAPAPFVLVNVTGGSGIYPGVGDDVVSVDCYGPDKATANKLARTVRAATWAIASDVVAGMTLLSGSEEVGPQWLPDTLPTIPLPRFVARYRVVYH